MNVLLRPARWLFALLLLALLPLPLACSDDDSPDYGDTGDGDTGDGDTGDGDSGDGDSGDGDSGDGDSGDGDSGDGDSGDGDSGDGDMTDGGTGDGDSGDGDGGDGDSGDGDSGDGDGAADLDPQLPPTDATEMTAWLAAKFYEAWICEEEPTAKTEGAAAIHAHSGKNRVCSNILLAASKAAGDGAFPKGVASVKEVFDDSDNQIATVVSVKTEDDSDGGMGWYWWAGEDKAGQGLSGCTGCHSAAGSDADHPGAGDFVYFQVRDEAELPTIGSAEDTKAWLDAGHYLSWTCENEKTTKTEGAPAIHVHMSNRVCTNTRLTGDLPDDGRWPAGVASVKEIYNGDALASLDVTLKVAADSAGGDGWYWYGGGNPVGFGIGGCSGCHGAAGSDADHPGAGDFVYFRAE